MLDETYYFVKKLYYFRIFFTKLWIPRRITANIRKICVRLRSPSR